MQRRSQSCKHTAKIFCITNDLKPGVTLSPLLFNIVLDVVIKDAKIKLAVFKKQGPGIILEYADNIDIAL